MKDLDRGIYLDSDPSRQKEGTTRKNRNVAFDIVEGFCVNEEGNAEHVDLTTLIPSLPLGSIPVGCITIDDDKCVVMTTTNNGGESIGILSSSGFDIKLRIDRFRCDI